MSLGRYIHVIVYIYYNINLKRAFCMILQLFNTIYFNYIYRVWFSLFLKIHSFIKTVLKSTRSVHWLVKTYSETCKHKMFSLMIHVGYEVCDHCWNNLHNPLTRVMIFSAMQPPLSPWWKEIMSLFKWPEDNICIWHNSNY